MTEPTQLDPAIVAANTRASVDRIKPRSADGPPFPGWRPPNAEEQEQLSKLMALRAATQVDPDAEAFKVEDGGVMAATVIARSALLEVEAIMMAGDLEENPTDEEKAERNLVCWWLTDMASAATAGIPGWGEHDGDPYLLRAWMEEEAPYLAKKLLDEGFVPPTDDV